MRRTVVVLVAVSVLMVQAVSALAQHEGRADDAGSAGLRAGGPGTASPEATTWVGALFPPPEGVLFSESGVPGDGIIGRSGGKLWFFQNMPLAAKTAMYWGPMANLILASFDGPGYSGPEVLSYAGISAPGNVATWNGLTHYVNGTPVYVRFRLTTTQGVGGGGPALPLTYAPPLGILNSAGAVLPVTSGLIFSARLEMLASLDNVTFYPALDVYDATNGGSSGAYTSVDAGFWYAPFLINSSATVGGTITPLASIEVVWGGSSPIYTFSANPCWQLSDVVLDGTTHLGAVANYQFTGVVNSHTIQAVFEQIKYPLGTSVVGNGTVQRTPGGTDYYCGTNVQLQALADPGWHFDSWSGDASGISWTTNVLMDGPKNVSAKFVIGLPVTGGPEVTAFALTRVAPNPASSRIGIEYTAPREAVVRLSVVDVQGRTVAVLADGETSAGRHDASWDFTATRDRLAAGLYFVRYEAPGTIQTRRFMLVR